MTLFVIHLFAARNGRVMKSLVLVAVNRIERSLRATRIAGVAQGYSRLHTVLKLLANAVGELLK
jgi:hypothetical protein